MVLALARIWSTQLYDQRRLEYLSHFGNFLPAYWSAEALIYGELLFLRGDFMSERQRFRQHQLEETEGDPGINKVSRLLHIIHRESTHRASHVTQI